MDGAEEVAGGFIVACGDGVVLLEPGEEVFDQVARPVEFFIVIALDLAVAFRRDDGRFPGCGQRRDHTLIGVVAFIGKKRVCLQTGKKCIRSIQIAGLTLRQVKTGRIPQGVGRGVDFRA